MITKNYIEMAEQAEEIQKAWKPKAGDYIYLKKNKQIYLISSVEKAYVGAVKVIFYTNIKNGNDSWCYENKFKDYFIYIPTQEQLLEGIMNSDCYALKISDTKYCQNENFGIKIFKQFGHYNIMLENSPSEFAYNWITWKEDSLNECLLDVYMFRLYYKYWHNEKWIVGMWNREDRQFNPIKGKWVKAE